MYKPLVFLVFLFTSFVLNAGVVKGVVRDSLGQPVPYAVVGVKSSTYGVNTNLNGAYFLELKPGAYTLVFNQLGYEKQEHAVQVTDDKPVLLDVTLRTLPAMLHTVEVKAKGNRDRGKEIMKQVVARRDDYNDRVQNYKCGTYQKSSLEKVPVVGAFDKEEKSGADTASTGKKKRKRKKEKEEEQGKEAEDLQKVLTNQKLNLIETISETFYKSPGKFHENILACHDFAEAKRYYGTGGVSFNVEYGEHEIIPTQYYSENPYLLVSDAQSIDFNFYRNQLDLPALCPRPVLSPAASTAFLNYRFELLDSFLVDDKWIFKLNVLPLFKEDALFSGLIFVQEGSFAIVSVNLCINPGVLLYCKEFCVIQDYSEVSPGIFLPVRREFSYTIREGKYNIIGNTRVDHSVYEVNTILPPETFGDEVKHYEVDAFDKDSVYWVERRTIQLEEKEIEYIHKVDSIAAYYASEEYLRKEDSAFNHINIWSILLNGVGHRNRVTGNTFYVEPLIAQVIPFGVGGYRHRLGGYYNRDLHNGMLLETDGHIDYGFLNKDVRGKVGVGLTYYPLRFVRTFVRFGDYYDMVNNYASLESVFARSNWIRCREFSIAQRMEIINGLFGEVTFELSDQFPLTGMQLEVWSSQLFGSLNAPAEFNRYVKTEVRFELKYRFKQKYIIKKNRKIIIGTKFPEVRLLWRKGINGLFGSEVNFDYLEAGSMDEMKIGRFGTSSWNVLAGWFINKHNLRLLEHKYFRGSDSFLFSDPMRSFQLLGPRLSTADAYFRLNYIHHFEGVFGSKVPLANKIKITSAFGGGLLMIPSLNFYHQEFFVGLERVVRIKKQLFRFGVYAVTADNTFSKADITYKFGVSFYNSFTRRWSY
ncbi:MAG TPA: DUF5686 and carboxypeptidase regulatory-like domain-containing protein [Bacteroidia bacterium]|nr:DUF5686 and carboxypeptidase regulatory-like domain-containing protein [Bacteroidia bacterium]